MKALLIFAFIVSLTLVSLTPSTAKVAAASSSDDRAIRAVIEAFRVGIIERDKAALNRLPVSADITFVASIDPVTLARLRTRRAEAKRLIPGTYPAFVEDIVSSKTRSEETFDKISVRSDGSVATVYFRYTFKEYGTMTNWGHESWSLVATDAGWKISSIIYSLNLPAPPKR